MSGDPLFLGIDGGASHCRARISDSDGTILGEGSGGPANVTGDPQRARASVTAAAEAAARAAGLGDAGLRRCHAGIGLAGVGGAEARSRLASAWDDFASIEVATDAYIAWLGAHGGEDGAVIVLGTGSIGYGHIEGRRHAVGGWGPVVSDEASGYAIGLSALRRAIWAADGRLATTPLADAVLSTVGGSAAAVAAFARGAEVVDIAALAPLVFRCARGDDPVALEIVHEAARRAACMIDRFRTLGAPRISLIGGVAEPIRPWLPSRITALLSAARHDPVDGAIMMIRRRVTDGQAELSDRTR